MAETPKAGPLTQDELLALWAAVTDPGYSRSIVAAGDDNGLEVIGQSLAQFSRASEMIDRTTQAMFILPWSGQTNEPAAGARRATVVVSVTRTRGFDRELTFRAGEVVFEEETIDFGPSGPVVILTGRKYAVQTTKTLGPGESGPVEIPCIAVRPGYGYNLAQIGGIRRFVQPGARLQNDGATVEPGPDGHRLVVKNQPDVVVPEHVGQYVLFTAGANSGQLRRATGYEQPVPDGSPPNGGTLILAATGVFRALVVGTFLLGETVQQMPSGATGKFIHQTSNRVVIDRTSGVFATGQTITGLTSGATASVDAIEQSPDLVAEIGTAAWFIPAWEEDLECVATNRLEPAGGKSPMLDELGSERELPRSSGEGDEAYRRRVSTPADVVSPNAILRAANRVLAPQGASACLREVGLSRFIGMFFDGDPSNPDPAIAFAYDFGAADLTSGTFGGTFIDGEEVEQVGAGGEVTRARIELKFTGLPPGSLYPTSPYSAAFVRRTADMQAGVTIVGLTSGATISAPMFGPGLAPGDRFKLALDYAEFRGFFLVGVPPLNTGSFGIAYDAGEYDAYDAFPFLAFFDGTPVTAQTDYRSIWQAIDRARAGGVGFDLYVEDIGCA